MFQLDAHRSLVRTLSSLLCLPLFALPALAQDSFPFEIDGRIALGASSSDSDGDFTYGTLNLEGEVAFDTAGTFGIGFDIFALSNFEDEPADYVDLYLFYNLGPGQVQLGYAQSAIDLFLPDHPLTFGARNEFLLPIEIFLHSTFVRQISYSDDPALGLAYFGDFGAFEAAASVHFNQAGDGTVVALAGLYTIQPGFEVFGGTEIVEGDGVSADPRYWVGARYDANGFLLEGLYSNGVNFNADRHSYEFNARYRIAAVEGLTIGASLFSFHEPSDTTDFYSLGAEYIAANGLGIGASLTGADEDFDIFSVEASFNF